MKYSLSSLMIVALVLPPLLSLGWVAVRTAIAPVEQAEESYDIGPPGQLEKSMEEYEAYLRSHPPAPNHAP